MPATPSGSPACPDADRPSRLADQIPDAATLRVSLTCPAQTWPQPCATARDTVGQRIEVSRATSRIAAGWILRIWPEAEWTCPLTVDLATTAPLIRSGLVAAGRGR